MCNVAPRNSKLPGSTMPVSLSVTYPVYGLRLNYNMHLEACVITAYRRQHMHLTISSYMYHRKLKTVISICWSNL